MVSEFQPYHRSLSLNDRLFTAVHKESAVMASRHVRVYIAPSNFPCVQFLSLVCNSLRLPVQCLRTGKECVYIRSRRGRRRPKSSTTDDAQPSHPGLLAPACISAFTSTSLQPELEADLYPDHLIHDNDAVFDSLFFNPSYPFTLSLDYLLDDKDLRYLGVVRQYRYDHDMLVVADYVTFLRASSKCSPIYLLSLDAYYIWIHPTFPALPDPQYSPVDRPIEWCPGTPDELPSHCPSSPLILAILAIVIMIPMPSKAQTNTPATRRQISSVIATRAYDSIVFGAQPTSENWSMVRDPAHPLVPTEIESVVALCMLGQYEYLQNGNLEKMQRLTQEALDSATRLQLHIHLSGNQARFDDARQRAWWTVVCSESLSYYRAF